MQRGGDLDEPLALGDEVLLEVVDVGLQEVAPGEQRLHLALDLHPLGLAGLAGLGLGVLDAAWRPRRGRRRGWRRRRRGPRPSSRSASALASATVVSAVRWASSSVRLIVSASSTCGRRLGAARRLRPATASPAAPRCDSSWSRATAARARASIAVASFWAVSSAAATSSTNASTSRRVVALAGRLEVGVADALVGSEPCGLNSS